MSDKIMVDIQKLSNLEKEIEILEKRREEIQREYNRINEECVKRESEATQKVDQKLSEIKVESEYRNSLLLQRTNALDEREKNIILMEKDFETIHQEAEELKNEKKKLVLELEQVELAKTKYLESRHESDLLIEQYTAKLAELK